MYFGRDSEDMHKNDIAGYRDVIDHNRDSAKVHVADIAVSGHLAKYLEAGLTKSANLNIETNGEYVLSDLLSINKSNIIVRNSQLVLKYFVNARDKAGDIFSDQWFTTGYPNL